MIASAELPHFRDMRFPEPDADSLAAEYAAVEHAFEKAMNGAERFAALEAWDRARRRIASWQYLVGLRFQQDTRDPERRLARERSDALQPTLQELDAHFMRRLLASPQRAELEVRLGRQAFALWEAHVGTSAPAIAQHLVREASLGAQYTELTASARIEFRGESLNLSGIARHFEDPDREIRRAAAREYWGWFAASGDRLDRIYDDLVRVRTEQAHALGDPSFVELGYRRMRRIDYGRDDVERFRTEIERRVVPVCVRIREQQRERLGVERLLSWDEPLLDPAGNARPEGGTDWLLERAAETFAEMGVGLGEFFALLRTHGLLDLETREGKAPGGFCTDFPELGVPFVFANFNGTQGDVEVFTHEMGHAFQAHCSRDRFPVDYVFPTAEGAEIHSMSLEFLTWPWTEKFFGRDAQRFRSAHLRNALLLLPYVALVDHFQHRVYEQPDASPARRHELWRELERHYLPWREYADLAHPARGAAWQRQIHVYQLPFYYIDYGLAQVCALQFWLRSRHDPGRALADYAALCHRGGEAPFRELVRSAGLQSPFEPGVLDPILDAAAAVLEL